MQTFDVFYDYDYEAHVVALSQKAVSFAMVPKNYNWICETKNDAFEVARLVNIDAENGHIELKMIETPDRFERVADKIYGCEWE